MAPSAPARLPPFILEPLPDGGDVHIAYLQILPGLERIDQYVACRVEQVRQAVATSRPHAFDASILVDPRRDIACVHAWIGPVHEGTWQLGEVVAIGDQLGNDLIFEALDFVGVARVPLRRADRPRLGRRLALRRLQLPPSRSFLVLSRHHLLFICGGEEGLQGCWQNIDSAGVGGDSGGGAVGEECDKIRDERGVRDSLHRVWPSCRLCRLRFLRLLHLPCMLRVVLRKTAAATHALFARLTDDSIAALPRVCRNRYLLQ